MKRRLNYTGRKRINIENVKIKLVRDEGKCLFSADINLEDITVPENSEVFIEAYHKTSLIRYDLGVIEKAIHTNEHDISEFAEIDNILFRIKIVDTSGKHGLILAEAEGIHPIDEGKHGLKRDSILPVEFCDLRQQVWRINFDADPPVLEINKNIPDIQHFAKNDHIFFFCVYPAVLREVLTHLFFVEGIVDSEDPEREWQADWIDFAKQYSKESIPRWIHDDPEEAYKEDCLQWIDKVVEEFCFNRKERWKEFIHIAEGGLS